LTKPSDAKGIIEKATKEFGAVDILVNNAGIQHINKVEEFPDEMWEKVISLNLSSNFYTTKAVIPQMKQRGWGRIINIASVHGLVASVNKSAYVAAKHGLVGFTKATALETAGSGITCNVICPGWVLTPLIQKQIDIIKERDSLSNEQATKKLVSEKQPSGQFSVPEDIGGIATYLCTDYARQMTGASYTCDGGWTAQ
jgi:3-hydroxybutyrate dehydrogenase